MLSHTARDLRFLVFWSIMFCVVGIGWGSLATWDEAYYALVSKGIYLSGDWVNLSFFGQPFYDKPPLYFWATAVFYHIFGINEFATRLCSGLGGVGTVILTYFAGKHLFDRRVGLAGAGVLLSSTDFLHYSRWATLDITNLFFFTAVILLFLKSKGRPWNLFWFWMASAGAVMTKGGLIVLAWGIVGIYSLFTREWNFLRTKHFWAGFFMALALVIPWHLMVYYAHPYTFMRDIVTKHYLARTSTAVEGHIGTYYFYIRTLINKYHPWVVLAAVSLPLMFWRLWKTNNKHPYLLLLIWILVVFGFFTFVVQTKLQWYILHLHPALSITVGLVLVKWLGHHSERRLKALIVIVLLLHIPFSSVIIQDYTPGLKYLAPTVQKQVGKSQIVHLYGYANQPAGLFYFDRPTANIESISEIDEQLSERHPFWMIIHTRKYVDIRQDLERRGFREIEATKGFKDDLVFLSNAGYHNSLKS